MILMNFSFKIPFLSRGFFLFWDEKRLKMIKQLFAKVLLFEK